MHIMFAYMDCQETEYYKVYKKYCSIVASKKFSFIYFVILFLGGGGGGALKRNFAMDAKKLGVALCMWAIFSTNTRPHMHMIV